MATRFTMGQRALTMLCLYALAAGCGSPSGGFSAQPAATTTQSGFKDPLDTVPTSDGSTFFFTATAADGRPAVFKVPAIGGAAAQIAAGPPLTLPSGIAISSDNQTLYIADPGAGIVQLSAAGGNPQVVTGTAADHPRGLAVVARAGADVIYFTGDDATSKAGAVFSVPDAGGAVTEVLAGAPLKVPVGVTVAQNGDLYVSNPPTFAATAGAGDIIRISGGAAAVLVSGLQLGYPAGVALDLHDTTLFVSGLDAAMGHAVVYTVDLRTKAVSSESPGISQNTGAGGVHRAGAADVLGWAGVTVGGSGTIYRIEFK